MPSIKIVSKLGDLQPNRAVVSNIFTKMNGLNFTRLQLIKDKENTNNQDNKLCKHLIIMHITIVQGFTIRVIQRREIKPKELKLPNKKLLQHAK